MLHKTRGIYYCIYRQHANQEVNETVFKSRVSRHGRLSTGAVMSLVVLTTNLPVSRSTHSSRKLTFNLIHFLFIINVS